MRMKMTHADISLKTKQAMVASLKKIAQKKPLSKITISELCHDCSINRKTFYYHFEDIYALVRWMLEQEALESVRSFDPLTDYKELIHFIIDYVDANNHILSCIYDTMGREGMKRVFLSDFKVCVNAIIERIEKDINASISPDYRRPITSMISPIGAINRKATCGRVSSVTPTSSLVRITSTKTSKAVTVVPVALVEMPQLIMEAQPLVVAVAVAAPLTLAITSSTTTPIISKSTSFPVLTCWSIPPVMSRRSTSRRPSLRACWGSRVSSVLMSSTMSLSTGQLLTPILSSLGTRGLPPMW